MNKEEVIDKSKKVLIWALCFLVLQIAVYLIYRMNDDGGYREDFYGEDPHSDAHPFL